MRSPVVLPERRLERIPGAFAALFLITAGCGGPPDAPPSLPDPDESFDGRVLFCPRPGDLGGTEKDEFAVDHMTRKLRAFPAFAEYAGLSEVTSCEEARAYTKAYREFSTRTPNFDRGPRDLSGPALARTPMSRLKLSVPGPAGTGRLFDSDYPRAPNPIVHIKQAAWGDDGNGNLVNEYCQPVEACTGTFIAKNWILTAAHCLQAAHLKSASKVFPNRTCPQGQALPMVPGATFLRGDADWIIRWTANKPPAQFQVEEGLSLRVRQLPHPKFVRVINTDPVTMKATVANNFDVALLYLPSANQVERSLPPDPDSGGAAFLSAAGITPASSTRDHMIAGWGLPEPFVLKAASVIHDVLEFKPTSILSTHDGRWNGAAPCPGDSGSPLFRADEVVFGTTFPMVITGVLSGMPVVTPRCATTGDEIGFTRVEGDDNQILSWINTEIRRYNGSLFSCRRNSGENYIRCWGEPCQDDLSCPPNKVCRGAASEYRDGICSPGICGGGCSCIVGQCVPGIKNLGMP